MRPRKSAQVSTTILLEGIIDLELEVSASVTPYIPATMYRKNGDPGDPAEGGDIEDLVVMLNGLEILKQLTPEQVEKIEEHIYKEAADQDDGPDPDEMPKWERDEYEREKQESENGK